MYLLQHFNAHIRKKNLISPGEDLILGISGGIDSIVLCHLLLSSGHKVICAHVNFGLRNDESNRDEEFVKAFCIDHQLVFRVIHPDTRGFAEEKKMSIQEAARQIRYDWFYQLSDEYRYAKIITAHHADDNVETMMMYFLRGTGIHGLTGIPSKNGKVIRPLLPFTRKDIEAYAKQNFLSWVEDSSNLTTKYTRNLIRNRLLPFIYELFPAAEQSLYENLQRFKDASQIYDEAIARLKKKLLENRGKDVHIAILKLLKSEPLETVLYECTRDYGFSSAQLKDILELCHAANGKYVASSTHRIIRNRNWLVITGLRSLDTSLIPIDEQETNVQFEHGSILIETISISRHALDRSSLVADIDGDKIRYPMLLRKWKQGDYFYPLGMKKKKKVSRFLIDQKLSIVEKEKTFVIESDKKIVWIVGLRIDDRAKISSSTKNVIRLRLEPVV